MLQEGNIFYLYISITTLSVIYMPLSIYLTLLSFTNGANKCLLRDQRYSTGKPTTGLISEAKDRSSATSSSVRLQPIAPANSLACSAFLAPGMGITFPCATNQFNATYATQQNKRLILFDVN